MGGVKLNGRASPHRKDLLTDSALVTRWKLGLRPEHLPLIKGLQLPELPPNVSIDQIFADFFSFVKLQIMLYISRSYADGANIWETLEPSMYFILTTPNGWEGAQQDRMRKAAIKGGLVDKNGGRRIKFVTEAEVSNVISYSPHCVLTYWIQGRALIRRQYWECR